MTGASQTYEGGCTCRHLRYCMVSKPMIVHCCHCRKCQRQTGTAFALNALIEADRVRITAGTFEEYTVKPPHGNGPTIARCPNCRISVWSNYQMSGLKKRIRFMRVGTLDNPDLLPPDVHIFTASKQPWVLLPDGAEVTKRFYDYNKVWSPESLNRRVKLFEDAGINMP